MDFRVVFSKQCSQGVPAKETPLCPSSHRWSCQERPPCFWKDWWTDTPFTASPGCPAQLLPTTSGDPVTSHLSPRDHKKRAWRHCCRGALAPPPTLTSSFSIFTAHRISVELLYMTRLPLCFTRTSFFSLTEPRYVSSAAQKQEEAGATASWGTLDPVPQQPLGKQQGPANPTQCPAGLQAAPIKIIWISNTHCSWVSGKPCLSSIMNRGQSCSLHPAPGKHWGFTEMAPAQIDPFPSCINNWGIQLKQHGKSNCAPQGCRIKAVGICNFRIVRAFFCACKASEK